MDKYAQQDTVNAYRFELGNVGNPDVVQRYIDETLAPIDSCLARRVAYGIGATMPPMQSSNGSSSTYPSLYPLNTGYEPNKSNEGLQVALLANDTLGTTADVAALMSALSAQKVSLTVIAPYVGTLKSGVVANASFILAANVFYDAVFIGSPSAAGGKLDMNTQNFVMGAYGDGKAIGAIHGGAVVGGLGIAGEPGVYVGGAAAVVDKVLKALSGPVRFPQRFPTDDLTAIC